MKQEMPPQDEEDDVKSNEKMEKKEEVPSHDEDDDKKRNENMKVKVKAEASPHDEKNYNEVPQEGEDEDEDQTEDELLAWFQPFIAEAMGYSERATHFASHYEGWDYFDF